MLRTFRKGASSFFSKVLLGLLVLSFAAWGVGDIAKQSSRPVVAEVGGEPIYLDELNLEIRKMTERFAGSLTPQMLASLNIHQIKLREMIEQRLVDLETSRLGIHISEEVLTDNIANDGSFKNENGQFDKTMFRQILRQNQLSDAGFFELRRKELTSQILLGMVGVKNLVPDAIADALYTIKNERREVTIAIVNDVNGSAITAPTDAEIQSFYDTRKTSYTAPEYRKLSYVMITPEQIAKSIKVTRQEAFELYQQRSGEYKVPEKREINQLLYKTKSESENAYNMLLKDVDFTKVSQDIKPINKDSISLGTVFENQLSAGGEQVFSLGSGEYSSPIKSPFGWHIFQVKSIIEATTSPFEEVQKALVDEIRQNKSNETLLDLQEGIEDALASGSSLKQVADEHELKLVSTDSIDQGGFKIDNSPVLDDKKYTLLLQTAFKLIIGEQSEFVADSEGNQFIVEVNSITPSREKAFDEVKGLVVKQLQFDKQQKHLNKYANELAVKAQKQTSNKAAIATLKDSGIKNLTNVTIGFNGIAAGTLPIGSITKPLDEQLVRDAFSLATGKFVTNAYPYGKGYALAILNKRLPSLDKNNNEEGKKLYASERRSLEENYVNDLRTEFIKELRSIHKVTINDNILQKLIAESHKEAK